MNREEFLRQLERLLSGISEEERADAIAFYRSYFEDAGEENEASVIAELESPQKVAESIMSDSGAAGRGDAAEHGNRAEYAGNRGYDGNRGYGRNPGYDQEANAAGGTWQPGGEPKKDNTARVVGIVAVVLTAPFWLTGLLTFVSVVFALVVALFGIALAIVGVMAALVISGFALFGIGIGNIFSGSAAVGIALMGSGLLTLAFGALAVLLTVWVFGVFLPWAVKGLWNLCKKPFDKRKERAVS